MPVDDARLLLKRTPCNATPVADFQRASAHHVDGEARTAKQRAADARCRETWSVFIFQTRHRIAGVSAQTALQAAAMLLAQSASRAL